MTTLYHEDVYIYVEKIEESIQTLTGSSPFSLTNNAIGMVVDKGIVEIKCLSGTINSVQVTRGSKTIVISRTIALNKVMRLDFRNGHYTNDGVQFMLLDQFDFTDNAQNSISVVTVGTSTAEVKYRRLQVVPQNQDLYFCTSIDVSESYEWSTKNNIKGERETYKTDKKDFTFSINGLWNSTQANKFKSNSGLLRIRIEDELSNPLETLANCSVSSNQRNSAESSDLTFSISGACGKIF